MLSTATNLLLPAWARLLTAAIVAACLLLAGWAFGERHAGEAHLAYVAAQGTQTQLIVRAQAQVVRQTEIAYRDRIKTIYVKGDAIEKFVPVYVTAADDARYGVNAGFVRLHDAAWSGDAAGAAAESDREPGAVSLAEVSAAIAHNATACLAWREQALGLRAHYAHLQAAINGKDDHDRL